MHSIRFRITAVTVAAILTTILSVLGACAYTIRQESDRKSVEIMTLISEDTRKSLGKYFESVEQSVEMIGNIAGDTLDSVILVECGAAGTYARQNGQTQEQAARLDAYLSGYCKRVQEAFESVASRTHGAVAYYFCILPEISQTQRGFLCSKVGKTGFFEQEPVDVSTLDPSDTEHNAWYFSTVQRGRPSWVGPYRAEYLDNLEVCSYIVPIYKAGTLVGVLGMDIPFETLTSQISSIQVYATGFACLYDEDGHVLYHPRLESGSTPDLAEFPAFTNLLRGESSGNELIRAKVYGEKRQITFTTLTNGMKLVITVPTREINSSWIRLSKIILIVTVTMIAFFSLVLMIMMRLITRPLVRLTAASRKLASEDYDVDLGRQSKDEVGELVGAFSRMREKLKLYIGALNHQVNSDPLTDLPNMRYFFKLATQRRDQLLSEGKRPAMVYFNLIGMRHYNRQYGFEAGDRLLKEIAGILTRHYSENSLCRFSEDHFAAVTQEEGLEDELSQIFRECAAANGGSSLPVRAGIYRNRMGIVDVNEACDRAKYACDKYRGSYVSGYYYFDEKMLRNMDNVRYVISHLDQALEEGWIKVYYQPIVRAVNGRVCDEEALSRWIDPEKGVLSPADFIPVLENARLIYKMDLYVVDRVLEKMNRQKAAGMTVVPHSINLSRSDFDACDIVEEIRRRVDAANISRSQISIEITESVIGSDFAFMKKQVERFQALGFPVWMDDFGSGYSSLDVLQSIKFNLLKFDMSFLKKLNEGDDGKIILTELMKMANALGVDTICEGVETEAHVHFLQEIGCSKLQGFYYCKAIPLEDIQERYRKAIQIGYENPDESAYFESLGRVNLFDLSVIASEDQAVFRNSFNTLPMGIIEIKGDTSRFARSNQSYRDFVKRFFGIDLSKEGGYNKYGISFMNNVVKTCCQQGQRAFYDEKMPDGSVVHFFARRVGVNPVTGNIAVAVVVLSITEPNEGASYADIARALAADYYNIYIVDLETDQYIEYTSPVGQQELAMERHGEDFFASSRRDASRIYEPDREAFYAAFSKEKIVQALDQQGMFTATYRLMDTGVPVYANMKIMRMQSDSKRIIIGISIVDAQMKEKEMNDRMRQERIAYERISALSEDYVVIYTVDPKSGHYREYITTPEFEDYGLAKEGEDFFARAAELAPTMIHPDDVAAYLQSVSREKVLRTIREHGIFTLNYRLMIQGRPRHVSFRAALVREADGDKLIIGIRAWKDRKD